MGGLRAVVDICQRQPTVYILCYIWDGELESYVIATLETAFDRRKGYETEACVRSIGSLWIGMRHLVDGQSPGLTYFRALIGLNFDY